MYYILVKDSVIGHITHTHTLLTEEFPFLFPLSWYCTGMQTACLYNKMHTCIKFNGRFITCHKHRYGIRQVYRYIHSNTIINNQQADVQSCMYRYSILYLWKNKLNTVINRHTCNSTINIYIHVHTILLYCMSKWGSLHYRVNGKFHSTCILLMTSKSKYSWTDVTYMIHSHDFVSWSYNALSSFDLHIAWKIKPTVSLIFSSKYETRLKLVGDWSHLQVQFTSINQTYVHQFFAIYSV